MLLSKARKRQAWEAGNPKFCFGEAEGGPPETSRWMWRLLLLLPLPLTCLLQAGARPHHFLKIPFQFPATGINPGIPGINPESDGVCLAAGCLDCRHYFNVVHLVPCNLSVLDHFSFSSSSPLFFSGWAPIILLPAGTQDLL